MLTPLIFLDCETTGLKINKHVPWEVGYVTAIHDTTLDELHIRRESTFQLGLSTEEADDADPEALKICGFDSRYSTSRLLTKQQAIMELSLACRAISMDVFPEESSRNWTRPHLVGACPGFDHNMLCSSLLGWPGFGEGLWHYHLIDVETLAAGSIAMPPPYSSTSICKALGVTVADEDKHTAMGDVQRAIRLYCAAYGLTIAERSE